MPAVLEEDPSTIAESPGAPANGATAPVRVLHLINGEHYSGAERVQDLLAGRLADFGFEVGFACLKKGRFAEMRQSQAAPVYDVSMRSRWDIAPAIRIAKLVREQKFSLIHTHTPRTALLGRVAATLAGVPMVHHLHSPTANDSTRRVRNAINAWIERRSMARAARIVAVSHTLLDYAQRQGFDGQVVQTVHNGVPARALRHRSTPQDAWTIGTVALFRPRKGLEVLIEALARLRDERRPVRLLAVGPFETPEYQTQILERVERLKLESLVEWTGFTKDVASQLDRMDAFVLPSLFGEGLPMVLLEAMAAGVPVIGTRVEGVPEAIRDGVDGLIAAPGDPDDLARALRELVSGRADWQQLRVSANDRQRQHFSDVSMAEQIAEIYREVLH